MLQLPPLNLYVHVPWCVRKCPYCDFNSHKSDGDLPEEEYVRNLLADLDQDLMWAQGRELHSIFIGGGTPSLLSAAAYQTLFDGLQQRLAFSPNIEITLEANPGTFEAEKFAAYRDIGINRLSIGIQSFNDDHLRALGRIHDSAQAQAAVTMAVKAGFDNFNLDLMHGLPGQTPEQALADLRTALSFNPQHLSWYQLTLEPNTEFYSKPPLLPEDDALWDIQEAGLALLEAEGFDHYEISAHARPGKASKHNLNYWTFGDYIGIGAGAHGKITLPDSNVLFRTRKTRMPSDYLNPDKLWLAGKETIEPEDIGFECLMNGLRLRDGISAETFEDRTGLPLDSMQTVMDKAQAMGLLEVGKYIRASAKGRQYLNELLALFLND